MNQKPTVKLLIRCQQIFQQIWIYSGSGSTADLDLQRIWIYTVAHGVTAISNGVKVNNSHSYCVEEP
jgi:hypothetical protein